MVKRSNGRSSNYTIRVVCYKMAKRDPARFQLTLIDISLRRLRGTLNVSNVVATKNGRNDSLRKQIIVRSTELGPCSISFPPVGGSVVVPIEYQGRVLEPHREISHVSRTMFARPRAYTRPCDSRAYARWNRCVQTCRAAKIRDTANLRYHHVPSNDEIIHSWYR